MRNSVYVDPWDAHQPRATVIVSEDQPSARVTYRNNEGQRFRVVVVKQPNPIGFHAPLPGDAKRQDR